MRSLLVMWNPYPQAPEVSIVRTDTCTAFDPTGGVPQPAPFPIAKSVLPNPIADPGPGHRSPDAPGQCPPGQNCCPGYRALVTTPGQAKKTTQIHPQTASRRRIYSD